MSAAARPDEAARGEVPPGDRMGCLSVAVPVVALVAVLVAWLWGRR